MKGPAVLKDSGGLSNPTIATPIMQRAVRSVCAIVSGAHHGTGVLIGPDLVLTAHHVVGHIVTPEQINEMVCIFDYVEPGPGAAAQGGMEIGVSQVNICSSPPSPGDIEGQPPDFIPDQLDYAILQLASPMGRRPASDGLPRGWVPLPHMPAFSDLDDEIFLFQHPVGTNFRRGQQPLRYGIGEISGMLGQADRIVHTASSAPGSSGGPCFNRSKDFAFVGLHNAGHTDDDGVEKRFVPLYRIVSHIKRELAGNGFVNQLFTEPPSVASPAAGNSVDVARRRDVALCLMDRTHEERKFRLLAQAKPVDSQAAVPRVHVIVCREDDKPDLFAMRLEYLPLHTTYRDREVALQEGLSKGALSRTFSSRTDSWPGPDRPERRMDEIDTLVSDLDADGNQLIVLMGSCEDARDVESERALIEHLASSLGKRFQGTSSIVQCVICLTVPERPDADAIIDRFKGLWPETAPPPGCGICIELSDIAHADLAEWRKILKSTWGETQAFSSEMEKLFRRNRRQRMARLVDELRDDIEELIRTAGP